MRGRGQLWIWAGIAAAALSAGLWLLIAGDQGPNDPTTAEVAAQPMPPSETTKGSSQPPVETRGPTGTGPEPDPTDRAAGQRRMERIALRSAERTYRSYIRAINGRNGAALCTAILPGFLAELRPPISRGACAERIAGSIGFADARGFPVWEATTLNGIESARINGRKVQLTAAIVTEFADREQPSVESDVAYLLPGPGGYRLAKASGALWRAVGKPDVPPQVVAAPPGFND